MRNLSKNVEIDFVEYYLKFFVLKFDFSCTFFKSILSEKFHCLGI